MFQVLFDKISRVESISSSIEETWVALNITGVYQSTHNKSYFVELHEVAESLGIGLSMLIDNDKTDWVSINDELVTGAEWRIAIDKALLFTNVDILKNFFFHKEKFLSWAHNSNPFSNSYPLNAHKCMIEVYGLGTSFGGPNIVVNSTDSGFPEYDMSSFEENNLLTINRFFTSQATFVRPSKHILTFGELNEYSLPFYKNAVMCMILSLCDEIYDDKVILRGVRRIEQSRVWTDSQTVDLKYYHDILLKTIRWVYDADSRYELRHKLLMDRITLDIQVNGAIFDGMTKVLKNSLDQAVERYHFAIYERGTQYQNELRDLLKDLRFLSELYSSKVRSIIGNLSRDVLAGLLTVGVTLFSRYAEMLRLSHEGILTFVFKACGVYFFCSIMIQTIFDWMDLSSADREFDHWKDTAREYLTVEEFQTHKNETVGKRRIMTRYQYAAIGLIYLGLSIFCYFAPNIWIKNTEVNVTNGDSEYIDVKQKIDSTCTAENNEIYDTTSRIKNTMLHITHNRE